MLLAPVNKIIDSSVVDGPGNRTAIFFQSCNYNCRYCHNPETINMCLNCGKCVALCPAKALNMIDGKVVWDFNKCCNCDTCIKNCPNDASPRIVYMSVDEVFEKVENNMPFIRGITVSGGECTIQIDFVKELFKKAKENNLGTLYDSNGSYDFEKNPESLQYADGVMLDIKAGEDDKHMWLTGVSNATALKNANYLASIGKLEEIRTVVIPGSLNNEKTIEIISEILAPYLKSQSIKYKLIKYRHFGVREKYRDFKEPTEEYMESLRKLAIEKGFKEVIII